MHVSTIAIENFRGIQRLTLEFDHITVLVGQNNACKTTILDAMRICLKDLRSNRSALFDAHDFHLTDGEADPTQAPPIAITLTFQEREDARWPEPTARRLNQERIVHVVPGTELGRVRLAVTGRYDATLADFTHEWHFLDAADNPMQGPTIRGLNALQDLVPFYYLSALRDATRHFDAKGMYWRPFLRGSSLSEVQRAEIEGGLRALNDQIVDSHTGFAGARERLTMIQQVVPMAQGDLVSINAIPAKIFDMLSRTQVSLGTTTGAKLPVDRHGEGTQSLAVLMLFNAFLDHAQAQAAEQNRHQAPIVALEEPEAHLHPSAVRALWTLIEQMPGQVIVSTHSGELASEVPIQSVRRLSRRGNGVTAHRLAARALEDRDQEKFDFHVRYSRGEILLASSWLMVEGESEVVFLSEVARFLDINLARNGVRIVPHRVCGLGTFLRAANELGIGWCVLADEDLQGASDMNVARRHLVDRQEARAIFGMPGDLETFLCRSGWSHVYTAHVPEENLASLLLQPHEAGYGKQLKKALPKDFSKPAGALEVLREIKRAGRDHVPGLFVEVLQAAVRAAQGV